MPRTPCRRTSSAILNALTMLVLSFDTVSRRSFGMTMRVSTFSLRIWIPFSACMARRRPSKVKGRVTTPMVSAPRPLAISATTGARAGPGAAALAGGDEDHVGALERLLDLGPVLLGGQAPHLGVAAGAQAPGELAPDVELQVGVAHQQRLGVGVGGDELDVAQPRVDHPVDGVDAAAADPDDLDHCQVVALGRHGRHELPRPRVDRRPVTRWWFPPDVTRGRATSDPSLNLWGRLMFTVRERGPTIRGAFRLVKHPTSPWRHRRRIGDADVDDIPVVQGGPRQNRGDVLVLGGELGRRCRCRPRSGVVRASCTQPAGSTVTAVTCAAKEGGQRRGHPEPGGVLGREHGAGRARAAAGTVRSSSPGGRAARRAEHPAVAAQRRPTARRPR